MGEKDKINLAQQRITKNCNKELQQRTAKSPDPQQSAQNQQNRAKNSA